MLLFRDEEHVDKWCRQWQMARGDTLSLDTGWRLAREWFSADRSAPAWQRPTVDDVESVFASLHLSGAFWALR